MKLQTLEEVETSIGGRPKLIDKAARMTFFVSDSEARQLKKIAVESDRTISQIIRMLVKGYLRGLLK